MDNTPTIEELKKEAAVAALERNKWNVTRAAAELGVGRSTLYRWMIRWGLAT